MKLRRFGLNSTVIWLLSSTLVWAAAPSRSYTYVTGQTIDPSQVTTNEDSVFSYLQAGVDTYSAGSVTTAALADNAVTAAKITDGTIVNADISTSAAIAGSKLAGPINTATALAANGANCSVGNYPLGVDASGAVESCTSVSSDVGGTNAVRVLRTAGDVTTTSGTLVDFTGATATITTGANPVLVGFAGGCRIDDAGGSLEFMVDIDGSALGGTASLIGSYNQAVVSEGLNCSFTAMSAALTAASHTIKLQWLRNTAGTATMDCDSDRPCLYWVMEVVD